MPRRRAKPAGRPLQPLPPRRMVPPADGLDHAAEQPRLQVATQARKAEPGRSPASPCLARTPAGLTAACGQRAARGPIVRAAGSATPAGRRAAIARSRARSKRGSTFEGSSSHGTPRASSVAVRRGPGHAEQRPQQAHVATARPAPPCRPAHRARSAGQPAWPRSRPGHRRDGRAAGAGCRAGGIRRAAGGSAPSRAASCRPAARLGARPRRRISPSMPWRAEQLGRRRRLAGRLRPQAMVDDQRRSRDRRAPPPSRAPAAPAPANRGRRKRRRQGRASVSNGSNGAISCAKAPASTGMRRPGDHPQPFFWRSCSTRRFCRSVARG